MSSQMFTQAFEVKSIDWSELTLPPINLHNAPKHESPVDQFIHEEDFLDYEVIEIIV